MPSKSVLATAAALLGSANAHMYLASPVPFTAPNGYNGPVDAAYPFPCKGGAYTVQTMNQWTAGMQQTLSFTGTASHSGGSCQVSVTTDAKPSAGSKWKVIHSIEGGCPTADAGNSANLSKFTFTVPKELPNGPLTMAWTWFNKSGNREFYMNCAPVTMSGGASDASGMAGLPDMATANMPGACTTKENFDYTFANPGKSVERKGKGPFMDLCGGAASSAPASSPPPKDAPPAQEPAKQDPPKQDPPTQAPPTQAPPAAGPGAACSTDGAMVCNGDAQFGICNFGKVAFQAVAAGTKCSNGAIVKRDA